MARKGVRIIAGLHRGRILSVPAVGTRPMTDRVRESVFSALGSRCVNARVLDAYAGSGAIGLEAISRGAIHADFVEHDRTAARIVQANIELLRPEATTRVHQRSIEHFLAGHFSIPYSLGFFDPPFAVTSSALAAMLTASRNHGVWDEEATIVVERPREDPLLAPEGFSADWERSFGGASIVMLRPAP